jgi:hypothetical protein
VGKDRGPIEIIRQISLVRQKSRPLPPGHLHWNLGQLLSNKMKVADLTRERAYPTLAIPPPSPWLSNETLPNAIAGTGIVNGKRLLRWSAEDARMNSWVRRWLLQVWDGKTWKSNRVFHGDQREVAWPTGVKVVSIRPLGKCWEIGQPAMVAIP